MEHDTESTIELLIGKTLKQVIVSRDDDENGEVILVCEDGAAFRAYHMQDCCESVRVIGIDGDIDSLIGSPITDASETVERDEWPADAERGPYDDSFTATTHRISTQSGATVAIRWLGVSNGYYSESVYFQRTHLPAG